MQAPATRPCTPPAWWHDITRARRRRGAVRLRRIPTHGEAGSRPVIATAAATCLGTGWHRLRRGSAGLGVAQRHAAAVEQILAGIVPSWVRRLTPVTLRTAQATATIHVIPDYIAIGS